MKQQKVSLLFHRNFRSNVILTSIALVFLLLILRIVSISAQPAPKSQKFDELIDHHAQDLLLQGRQIFRYDTFGSEHFWGDSLKLHESVAKLSPKQALNLGLKVDSEALPASLVNQMKQGTVNLDDPTTTLALLKLKAVVGVTGFIGSDGNLKSIGIQCALCHSSVDDSFSPGIGKRLDGWPNQDLNIGAIVATAPDLGAFTKLLGAADPEVRKVLKSWGPGKFDAELILDGKTFRPDGKSAATLIPPALGLAGVNNHTWTGAWGTVTYWNAFVANLEMHGQGTFFDPRLDNAEKYPIAAKAHLGHKRDAEDKITPKLAALHFYQLAIPTPKPPAGAFDAASANRGQALFNQKAKCATCHVPPVFTEPGWNLHTGKEIGIDDFQANRSPDGRYRTVPLRALFDTAKIHKGGFYHDGRFTTLHDVVDHYNDALQLGLSKQEINDLIEYLKSI